MSDPLATYLEDHLAGANAGIELLEFMRDENETEPLGLFLETLRHEIEADRQTLQELADRVGHGLKKLKEATAWLAEKVGRTKLGKLSKGEIGTFEALEALALGILGKRSLWKALAEAAPNDPRLAGMDFETLIERAESQHASVEEKRLELARRALQPAGEAALR
jgi:hypothetical protein